MNIIANRITRELEVGLKTSVANQARNKKNNPNARRRATYTKGVRALPHWLGVRIDDDLKQSLTDLCRDLNVERGVVVRDAIAFYIGLARQEGLGEKSCPTKARARGR